MQKSNYGILQPLQLLQQIKLNLLNRLKSIVICVAIQIYVSSLHTPKHLN